MSSIYGNYLKVSIFGQSHSPAIGMTMDGFPAGLSLDTDELQRFLDRRAPGRSELSSARREADVPEFLCGLSGGVTCGAPLTAIVRNTDAKPQDYDSVRDLPRPGHADWTAEVRYHGYQDVRGGGHFSGRLTAPLCIAGGICLQLLRQSGIGIAARIASIADVTDSSPFTGSVAGKEFPVLDDAVGAQMRSRIQEARSRGDSVGGVIECMVTGLPAGLGDPMFDGMENRIARIVFGIPAVKGLEFGNGFAAAELCGSENNDAFVLRDGQVVTETNRCGGILGGITTGMPLVFRAAIKPTPSIALAQTTVRLSACSTETVCTTGRHDPCIVPRAVPCMEAAAAIAVTDAMLEAGLLRR